MLLVATHGEENIMEYIFHPSNPVYLADTSVSQSQQSTENHVSQTVFPTKLDFLLEQGGVSVAVILGVTIFTGVLLDKVIKLVKAMK
jgi:hypothetical protein